MSLAGLLGRLGRSGRAAPSFPPPEKGRSGGGAVRVGVSARPAEETIPPRSAAGAPTPTLQRRERTAGLIAGILTATLLAACDDLRSSSLDVYVLHDISGTYFRELERNLVANKTMLLQLRSRDRVSIGQIVDCSFTDRAVIARTEIPDRPSERNSRVTETAAQLDRFRSGAKATPYTDIRGALLQAAAALQNGQAPRRMIVLFSDMQEDPAPSCRRDFEAPIDLRGITVVAVNVAKLESDNRNPQAYFSRLDAWRDFVRRNGGSFEVLPGGAELVALLKERG